jgi:DNA-binding NtrC family response regulator
VSTPILGANDEARALSIVSVGPDTRCASDLACRLFETSRASRTAGKPLVLIGRHALFMDAQERVRQFAHADSAILISGETGTGKELFARASHLLSRRRALPYVSTNCAQFQDATLAVSQLFGEIGELPLVTQAVLLRAIGEGEIAPLGDTRTRHVDVRLIAASACELPSLVEGGTFRRDLYHRLRLLHVRVPSLRERVSDIPLIAQYSLACLNRRWSTHRRFDDAALASLAARSWFGNVRELRATIEALYYASSRDVIGVADVLHEQEPVSGVPAVSTPSTTPAVGAPERAAAHTVDFWRDVYRRFIDRDLNREEVRTIMARGLEQSGGSFRAFLARGGVSNQDYLKAMDFLRHHDLKPPQYRRRLSTRSPRP